MTYSTCDTGKPDYQIWMMSLPATADPLVPGNWTQHPGPVFSRADDRGVYGPGHHAFFRSPDGTEDWIVHHAKTTSALTYSNRTTRAQRFTWKADGSPDFGRPYALGATQDLPSGDPGSGTYWINDDGRSSGAGTVSYTGAWNSGSGCATQCFWGDDHWNERAGDTATFTFDGTRIALLSVRDTGNGIAALSIDGGPEQRVDLYGSIRTGETLQYLSPRLPRGRRHAARPGHRRARHTVGCLLRERGPRGGLHGLRRSGEGGGRQLPWRTRVSRKRRSASLKAVGCSTPGRCPARSMTTRSADGTRPCMAFASLTGV